MRFRPTRLLLAFLTVAALLIACRSERESIESHGARSEPDTLSIADGKSLAKVDSLRGLAQGSAAMGESALPYPPVGPPGLPPVRGKTASENVRATAAELAELRVQLSMPVSGVLPADLLDSYADARAGHTHEAIDIHAPRGTAVLSATAGRLLKLHQSAAGGLMVYAADASNRFILMYGHLDRYAKGLTEGMSLRRGQIIGYVGTSGNAPPGTPHLHFSIARGTPSAKWWKGTPVNPYHLLTP
ncbi:MAG: M23 family metallopeptidase [Gemmatimonadaceae bacterium]